ncbi:unnamed protein product [Caenorhabditis bovis]|nr:unnamed protein product [Caenorhabditis bovis]
MENTPIFTYDMSDQEKFLAVWNQYYPHIMACSFRVGCCQKFGNVSHYQALNGILFRLQCINSTFLEQITNPIPFDEFYTKYNMTLLVNLGSCVHEIEQISEQINNGT